MVVPQGRVSQAAAAHRFELPRGGRVGPSDVASQCNATLCCPVTADQLEMINNVNRPMLASVTDRNRLLPWGLLLGHSPLFPRVKGLKQYLDSVFMKHLHWTPMVWHWASSCHFLTEFQRNCPLFSISATQSVCLIGAYLD